jgi:hypothetical protein
MDYHRNCCCPSFNVVEKLDMDILLVRIWDFLDFLPAIYNSSDWISTNFISWKSSSSCRFPPVSFGHISPFTRLDHGTQSSVNFLMFNLFFAEWLCWACGSAKHLPQYVREEGISFSCKLGICRFYFPVLGNQCSRIHHVWS